MKQGILACRINGEDVYFIKRPGNSQFDGFIKRGSKNIPIMFWSYIGRSINVEPIRSSPYLKTMWDGDTHSEEWANEYLFHLN